VSFPFGRKANSIPRNAVFRLTQEGRDKAQEFTGDPKSQILICLETRGTCDMDEIAQGSSLSRGQVERCIPSLVKHGYIQYLSSGSTSEEVD